MLYRICCAVCDNSEVEETSSFTSMMAMVVASITVLLSLRQGSRSGIIDCFSGMIDILYGTDFRRWKMDL